MQEVGRVGRFPVLAEQRWDNARSRMEALRRNSREVEDRALPASVRDMEYFDFEGAQERSPTLAEVRTRARQQEAPPPKPIDRSKLPTEYDRLTGDFLEDAEDPFS
jgi:hypothetical protein